MRARLVLWVAILTALLCSSSSFAEQVLFEGNFENGLSSEWELVGLKKEGYRIREGALELRVQPGKMTRETPMLKVKLPFTGADTVTASVEVTILDTFTEPSEFAGLYLTDQDGRDFAAKKQRLDGGQLVFAPGKYEFIGEPLKEEGDPSRYAIKFWPAIPESGPLRILVRGNHAYFQAGPQNEASFSTSFTRRSSHARFVPCRIARKQRAHGAFQKIVARNLCPRFCQRPAPGCRYPAF